MNSKQLIAYSTGISILILRATAAQGAPANDLFNDRTTLVGMDVSVDGNNNGASA
jgi:hypothetical protein